MTCRLYLLIKVNFKKQCGQDFFSFCRQGHQGQERKKKKPIKGQKSRLWKWNSFNNSNSQPQIGSYSQHLLYLRKILYIKRFPESQSCLKMKIIPTWKKIQLKWQPAISTNVHLCQLHKMMGMASHHFSCWTTY